MNKYINQFIRLKSAPDLLAYKIFPNVKEICESYSCRNILYKFYPHIIMNDPNINIIVIGDGRQPRTGAFFAFTTAHNIISIDPNFSEKWANNNHTMDRLLCIKDRAERLMFDYDNIVLIAPHAHVNINNLCQKWKFKTMYIVSMPCCLKDQQILNKKVGFHYRDTEIPSPENHLFGWKIIKEEK